MIEVIDRIPMYPGRVKLIPVAGQANTYDLVRADEPIVEGTPINKALFDVIDNEMTALRQHVADTLFTLSQRVDVGSLATGTVFGLYENGVLVPYIKLTNSYAGVDRALVVRKDCIKKSVLFADSHGEYNDSEIDLWLNNDFFSILDVATQNVIAAVNIQIATPAGIGPISRKVFLLSLYEYNMTNSSFKTVGEALSYFEEADRRTATFNGTLVPHWTRTNMIYTTTTTYITTDGGHTSGNAQTFAAGIRPAFTLPLTFQVTAGMPSTENVMATAEVI